MQHSRLGIPDRDVESIRKGQKPFSGIAIGFDIPELIFSQSNQDTIHDQAAMRGTDNSITGSKNRNGRYSPRKHLIQKRYRIRALDFDRALRNIVKHQIFSKLPVRFKRIILIRPHCRKSTGINRIHEAFGHPFVGVRRLLNTTPENTNRRRGSGVGTAVNHMNKFFSVHR